MQYYKPRNQIRDVPLLVTLEAGPLRGLWNRCLLIVFDEHSRDTW
jgi:hypothetical protein